MMCVEHTLYWAYEQARLPVVYHAAWTACGVSQPTDAYTSTHAAATWRMRVDNLPEAERETLRAKYGLEPSGLRYLAGVVQQSFAVDEAVARGLVLGWLKHPQRMRVWQMADAMDVSERTVKRLTRKVYLMLDDMNRRALFTLSLALEAVGVTLYNTNQLN